MMTPRGINTLENPIEFLLRFIFKTNPSRNDQVTIQITGKYSHLVLITRR